MQRSRKWKQEEVAYGEKIRTKTLAFLCICVFVCTDSCADCLQFYEFYDDWCDSWFFTGALCHIIYHEGTAPYDWRTLLLAVTVAFLSTLLGTIGAIGSFYAGKKSGQCINFLNQIPIANAEVVTGFSICVLMIVLFGVDKDTYLPLLVGQTVLCAPFAYLSVLPKLKQMDPNLYEAALDLGCNHRQALWRVIVREIMPGITSGFMLSVTLSLDDYFITTYTKPAVFDTISTYVVNATKGARTEIKTALWALSAIIFFVVVLVVIGMNMKAGRKQKR